MNLRAVLIVLLAIACGISAAVGMNQIRGRTIVQTTPEVKTSPVVVAKADIPVGAMITEQDVAVRDWPATHVPAGALTSVEASVERATTVRILAGEPLMAGKLSEKGTGGGMAVRIPNGMRAYTIQTPQVASNVAGFVLPGSRVDILLNLRGAGRDDPTGGGSTTTLLQAVEVLAVDQLMDVPSENKVDLNGLQSVTLLVTPQQAARLALGQSAGTLTLALRRAGDLAASDTAPEQLKDLWRKQEEPNAFTDSVFTTIGAMAKAWTAAQPPAASTTTIPRTREPQAYPIRTLRGMSRGLVHVHVTPEE